MALSYLERLKARIEKVEKLHHERHLRDELRILMLPLRGQIQARENLIRSNRSLDPSERKIQEFVRSRACRSAIRIQKVALAAGQPLSERVKLWDEELDRSREQERRQRLSPEERRKASWAKLQKRREERLLRLRAQTEREQKKKRKPRDEQRQLRKLSRDHPWPAWSPPGGLDRPRPYHKKPILPFSDAELDELPTELVSDFYQRDWYEDAGYDPDGEETTCMSCGSPIDSSNAFGALCSAECANYETPQIGYRLPIDAARTFHWRP